MQSKPLVPRPSLARDAQSGSRDARFVEPTSRAWLDPGAALRAVPESATIAGMFIGPLAEAARQRKLPLPSARARYVPFQFYPLREHVQLLIEAAGTLFGDEPLRRALRLLGRSAPQSLLGSTVGKVVLGSASGVHQVVAAIVNTYPVHIRPSSAALLEIEAGRAVVRLEQVHFFLDSHHVGVFEGALHHAGVRGQVRIDQQDPTTAELLLTWET